MSVRFPKSAARPLNSNGDRGELASAFRVIHYPGFVCGGGADMRAEALSRQTVDHACILVVEDEVLVRLEIADVLRGAGFRVAEAGNADEAILLLGALDIQLVCTDVRMPGSIDGIALTAFIKTNCPGVPVVIISGESTARYTPDLADARLTKPVDSARLIRKIQGLLARPAGDVNV